MTLIPQFKIGLWNAWLPILFYLLSTMLFSYILNKEGFLRGGDRSWVEKKDKLVMAISGFSYYAILIFSIWIPIQKETNLFSIAIVLYFTGLVLSYYTSINFVTAVMNKPVTRGIYKFSRNPIYLINILIVISTALLSSTWIMILALLPYIISIHFSILAEERYCKKKYGTEYEEYLMKVPRYILFF